MHTASAWLLPYYLQIKAVHIALVCASGSLFVMRGVAVLLAARWPMQRRVRLVSQVIDSALLLAALLLLTALQLNPLTLPWLRVKLGWLLAYIGFGMLALRRAPTRRSKTLAFTLALLCFSMMLTIARTHNPWGFLLPLVSSQYL